MLGKLMKYEIKATARMFLPMYLVILVFALINKLINPFNTVDGSASLNLHTTLSIISMMLYFALIVGIVVMTLVIMIQRFYKNLLGDEGYLMFTLPVKPWQHIISKLLIAMMWTVLSFIVIMLSIMILIGIGEIISELPRMLSMLADTIGYSAFFTVPFYAVLALAANIVIIYCAIALGHLFPKHKLISSFGMYCLLYLINQIIQFVFMLVFGRDFLTTVIAAGAPTPSQLNSLLLSLSIIPVIMTIGYFILTNFILKKKLNLE